MHNPQTQRAETPTLDRFMAIDADAINRAFVVPTDLGNGNALQGRYAVVNISGPLMQRATWWDGYDAIVERFTEALAKSDGVLLKIDSPGGMVAGCFEAVRSMLAAKKAAGKPVVAYVDEQCCSAAYALATVADAIVLPPSGSIGSVGVIATAAEMSQALKASGIRVAVVTSGARKADGHPAVPMTEAQIARLQADVNALADQFFGIVGAARGMSVDAVRALEAGVFLGANGVAVGLADATGNAADALALLDSQARKATQTFAASRQGTKHMDQTIPEVTVSVADHKAMLDAAVAGALSKAASEHAVALAALQGANADLSATVSAKSAELDAAKAKLAKLDGDRIAAKVDALVGKKAGITPATRDKWLALASSNEESFDAIVAEMPAGVIGERVVADKGGEIRQTDAGAEDKRAERYLALVDEKVKSGVDRNTALGLVLTENPNLLEG